MSDPVGISRLLADLAAKWGMDNPLETASLFGGWEKIVGANVAAKCKPVSLKDGVLQVRTASPAWASELRYLAPEVIRRINTELGKPVVTEVRAWVGSETGNERAGSTRARPGPPRPRKKGSYPGQKRAI